MYKPKVNSYLSCGLWVIKCGFMNCNKCTLWWGLLIMGEATPVSEGAEGEYESSVPSSLVYCEPETVLKNYLRKLILKY